MNMVDDEPIAGLDSVGQQLRAAREAKGLTIEDVASSTRIPTRHLQSLEDSEWHKLPGLSNAVLDDFEWFVTVEHGLIDLLDLFLDFLLLLLANLRILGERPPECRLGLEVLRCVSNGSQQEYRRELL